MSFVSHSLHFFCCIILFGDIIVISCYGKKNNMHVEFECEKLFDLCSFLYVNVKLLIYYISSQSLNSKFSSDTHSHILAQPLEFQF
jgi:hypothetical protein